MVEAWFSLHVMGISDPVYISEVADKSMNPDFQFFDLNINGPQVSRAGDVQLKLWAKTSKLETFILLVDLEICLESLQFIGKSLDNFHHPLPPNCILFHFEDGMYTSFTDLPVEARSMAFVSQSSAKSGIARPEKTPTYDTLMRLSNVDDCVQDALLTRAKLEDQINAILSSHQKDLNILDKSRQAQEGLKEVRRATTNEQRQIQSLSTRRDDLLAALKLRKDAIQAGRMNQSKIVSRVHDLQKAVDEEKTQSMKTLDESGAQVRRVCEDLEIIYPLEPMKNRPLHFRIRNLYLPNSVFDDTNRDEIAAAVGFASAMTHSLSLYLFTPLPYPISPNSSASTIEDPISIGITQRTFPLYPTNVSYKFEYGVFLLNKDVEFLMNKNGLQILDIRHTLPNLKYLLYVLTAGTGELPARKAGGIRALGTGRVTPTISRRGSEDSIRSSVGYNNSIKPSRAQTRHDSRPTIRVNSKEKGDAVTSARILPPPSGKAHAQAQAQAYQQSSLREAF